MLGIYCLGVPIEYIGVIKEYEYLNFIGMPEEINPIDSNKNIFKFKILSTDTKELSKIVDIKDGFMFLPDNKLELIYFDNWRDKMNNKTKQFDILIPSSYSKKSVRLNTKKKYRLILNKGDKDEEICIVSLKLKKYEDGEGYGTEYHYGYRLTIIKWEKIYWNHKYDTDIGTAPDFCEQLVEVEDEENYNKQ